MRSPRIAVCAALAATLAAAGPVLATAHHPTAKWTPRPATYGIAKQTNVPIRMDDGVVLKADVLRPAAKDGSPAKGPFPVLLTQTPYNKNAPQLNFENDYLIQRGYIQVIVDVRGTGSSGGQWASFSPREQKDYYETAVWAHRLKGGNGDVGLYGISYGAIDALLTAVQHPPGLKAMFPIVPMGDAYRDVAVSGGQTDTGFIPFWLGLVTGAGALPATDIATDPTGAATAIADHVQGTLAFQAPVVASATLGQQIDGYDAAFDNAFYRARSPYDVIDRVNVPTFIVGGEYDLFQRSEPMLYNALRANGVPTRLLIGPWTHLAGSSGAGLPADGVPSLSVLELRWFDHYLRGRPDPTLDTDVPPVTVYRIGPNRYERATAYPPADTRYRSIALSGSASVGSPGTLTPSRPRTGSALVPWIPVAGACSESTEQWTAGVLPAEPVCTGNHDINDDTGVAYDLPVTQAALRIAGTSMARLFVSTTRSDAMLTARLEDVAPDGTVTPLTAGWQVLSLRKVDRHKSTYRDGRLIQPWHPDTRTSVLPVEAGKIYELDVEIFPTLATIPHGHSLRLAIQTADEPHLTPPLPQTANSAGGTVTVYAGPNHRSALVLGIER
ncbi:MAG TPA: CocE/NonD family hydrolase [Mycobacteriales bacterium]|nr:CocE/NonD family hydrolase [Mycobacteriales bacterium]